MSKTNFLYLFVSDYFTSPLEEQHTPVHPLEKQHINPTIQEECEPLQQQDINPTVSQEAQLSAEKTYQGKTWINVF